MWYVYWPVSIRIITQLMKFQHFFIILISVATLHSCSSTKQAQTDSSADNSCFNGEWKLKDSWVFDSTLVFERIDKTIERPDYEEVFIIDGSSMKHEVRTNIGMCGNGTFFLDSASFDSSSKNVEMNLLGGYMVESTFKYKASYKVAARNDIGFTLELKKVILNESKSDFE